VVRRSGLAMAPDGSVCTISSSRAELVCVDQGGAFTRSPVPVVGRISIAADGSVWVANEGGLAQLAAAVPLDPAR